MIWFSHHWLWTPMTIAILLMVGLLLVVRVLIRSAERGVQPTGGRCPHEECRHQNPPNARYCAHCGRELRRS